jgi:hypothetical protein
MGSASETALPPNRRGVVAQGFVLVGAAIAVAVIVVLIVTWPHHSKDSASAADPGPTAAKQAGGSHSNAAATLRP